MSARLLLVLALCLTASRVAAQSDRELARAKASFKAGAAAYGAGDYTAAIEALELAYELTPLPAIAFSLAQARRRQYFVDHDRVQLERAVALFRGYLEQVASAGRRGDAIDALGQLEPLLAQLGALPAADGQRAEERRTRIMVSTLPEGARVSLDDGELAPAPLIREVQPGKHSIRVEAPGYLGAERETTAVVGELILTEIELRELPSRLVLSTPKTAEIYVDGRFVRRGGARIELALNSGRHALRVAQAGRRPFERTLLLVPGQALSLSNPLALTGQRKAARGLFVVSGALLATSAALLGVALAHERRAQDFLDRRERMNVSSDELARYREDLHTRDRLRTPTILTGTLAIGSLLAALLLHLLDAAEPVEPQGAPSYAKATQASRMRLQYSPSLMTYGVLLSAQR